MSDAPREVGLVDLLVIGGGTAGLAAAREGVRRGARTLLVTDTPPGGECTFTGCVPSKTLIDAAARGESFGDAMRRVHDTVTRIAATEDEDVLRSEGVVVLRGAARFTAPRTIEVDGRSVSSRRVVIAVGSRPVVPPITGLSDAPHVTSDTVWNVGRLPDSLAVVGGGAIGCELAQAFGRLGARVTVVEALDRLLAIEEPDASSVVREVFEDEGITLRLGRRVQSVHLSGSAARLRLDDESVVACDLVLLAVGRRASVDGLGLDRAGVSTDERGYVKTVATLATTSRGVYAAGDCTGLLAFTHAADEMGRLAAANALGRYRRKFETRTVPWVTFTDPEVARVGFTEQQAAAHGARVAVVPMDEVDRAITSGRERGFVKLVVGRRRVLGYAGGGVIVGATVVAARGGELVHEAALAMRTGMFAGRLAQTVHAYPTWSIAMRMAAGQLFRPVNGRRAREARPAAADRL